MRRIFLAALFALPLLLIDAAPANAQVPGYFGNATQPGYYRQSVYAGSPTYGIFSFAMRMYPLIHSHGPLVNYGPYEGYYPFEPYGPWTSDLKYNGPPITKHMNLNASNPATGWIWGGHSHGFGHGSSSCGSPSWGHYALSTFHNVGLRTHPFAARCKNCSASAEKKTEEIVPTATVAVIPAAPER